MIATIDGVSFIIGCIKLTRLPKMDVYPRTFKLQVQSLSNLDYMLVLMNGLF